MLRARDLVRDYDGIHALRGVSLAVNGGEIVALLGPNGAGKSTLLRILAGVLDATAGEAEVAGVRLPGGERELARRVGYVPQGESVYPELTVRENLRFFARLSGLRGRALRERSDAMLAAIALTDRAHQRAGTLSGGLRQRVALAASLVHDPQVLLLDEPGTGLDPLARDRLADICRARRDAGCAVLVSTHSLEEAGRIADRVVLLARGRVAATFAATETARIDAAFRALEASA